MIDGSCARMHSILIPDPSCHGFSPDLRHARFEISRSSDPHDRRSKDRQVGDVGTRVIAVATSAGRKVSGFLDSWSLVFFLLHRHTLLHAYTSGYDTSHPSQITESSD